MASTYVNDLRLNEMATGDASGTWGTTTNTNLELIAEAFSYGTEAITTNADTHTTTIADGATDPGRSMFLKYTGTLDSTCTITIGPNTVSKLWIIENGTSGSQSIIIKQGSGATVTIPSGKTKVIYADGAGSGGAMVDAFASLNLQTSGIIESSSSIQTPLIEYTDGDDAMTIADGGGVTFAQTATFSDDIIIGDGKTIGSASDVDAMTIAANGQVTFTQTLIGTALDISGDIDVDGTTNLDVVDIDGAVDMASTLQVDGAITGSSTINGVGINVIETESILVSNDGVTGTISSALRNTGFGYEAFDDLTTGDDNTSMGRRALTKVTTGSGNTAMGSGTVELTTTGSNNTGLGFGALYANTTADNNTAVGYAALSVNTTGDQNTAVGGVSMDANTTGRNNAAFGYQSLSANTTANQNAAFGVNALLSTTTGADNTAIGTYALSANTTAGNNTAVGLSALLSNTTGGLNTAVGAYSLESNTTGEFNVAMGYEALEENTTASNNTAFGYRGMTANTTGEGNTCIGSQSLDANTTGDLNTALGYNALSANTTADANTAVGNAALGSCTTGQQNTAVGSNCIDSLTTGEGNVAVGYNNDVDSGDRLRSFGIGINLSLATNNSVKIGNAGTNIQCDWGGGATWSHSSDERLKNNIQDSSLGLNFINDLRPVTYNWKEQEDVPEEIRDESEKDTKSLQHGLVAQEVKATLNKLGVNEFSGWSEGEDSIQRISESMYVFPLIKAVQELSTQVEELKAKLNEGE